MQTPNDYQVDAAAEALGRVYMFLLEVAAIKRQEQGNSPSKLEKGEESESSASDINGHVGSQHPYTSQTESGLVEIANEEQQ